MAEQPAWKDTQYLQKGNLQQRRAYAVLQELAILTTLSAFDPIVVGTIPIDVDLPGSDIDIICEVLSEDRNTIKQLLRGHYGRLPAFQLNESLIGGKRGAGVQLLQGRRAG